MYTIDKSILEEGVTAQLLQKFIRRHMREIPRINKLERYYRGEHDILKRQKKSDGAPNNKVVCNHAKEITDTATGYFVGNPITYGGDNADTLCEWFKAGDVESVDMEIATDMSKFGRAYELVYMSDDDIAIPKSCVVGTQNAFVVYSDDVTHIPLFGVYYYPIFDADESLVSFRVYLYTPQRCTVYTCDASFGNFSVDADYDNVFGDVPIIEYSNNKEQQGDFEQVIGLIDAYNVLMSDFSSTVPWATHRRKRKRQREHCAKIKYFRSRRNRTRAILCVHSTNRAWKFSKKHWSRIYTNLQMYRACPMKTLPVIPRVLLWNIKCSA